MIDEDTPIELRTEAAVVMGSIAKGTEENVLSLIDEGCVSVLLKGKLDKQAKIGLSLLLSQYQITLIDHFEFILQSTLVNSTMHNSILSLILTRRPGPGIFPYILLQFHKFISTTAKSIKLITCYETLVPLINFSVFYNA